MASFALYFLAFPLFFAIFALVFGTKMKSAPSTFNLYAELHIKI